jgi:putative ABC transport system permease protein
VAFAVAQRTREIGVRVALGGQRRDVVVLVASEGAWIALAGLAIGVLTAWILRRSVESMLFGVAPGDAPTFAGVPLLLGVVSVLSAYLPAPRRTHRSDCRLAHGVAPR